MAIWKFVCAVKVQHGCLFKAHALEKWSISLYKEENKNKNTLFEYAVVFYFINYAFWICKAVLKRVTVCIEAGE